MKSARINQYEGDILFNPSIRIFHYVCQFRTFTKAAKQLGITQSAVSQSIAQLEKQLGVELFDRTSRPMALTKEAQLLRNQILRDMSDMSLLMDEVRRKNYIQTSLSIGLIDSVGRTIGQALISALSANGRYVEIKSGTSDYLVQELTNGNLDCIIASSLSSQSLIPQQELILTEPHIIMMPKSFGHNRPHWTWDQLQFCGLPMIRYGLTTGSGEVIEKSLRQARLNLPKRFCVDDNQIMFGLVSCGLGWCLTQPVTALLAKEYLSQVILTAAPYPCENRQIFIAGKTGLPKLFIEEIKNICREQLMHSVIPQITSLMPWLKDKVIVY